MENDNKKRSDKEDDDNENYKDYFWIKVLIVTIVIVWISLAAGSWVGNYLTATKILPGKEDASVAAVQKPKAWKTIVEVDSHGNISKTAALSKNETEPDINDFRNIDDPIPGIDDQSIKSLNAKDIPVVQEPAKQEPPELPTANDTPKEEPKAKETENTAKTDTPKQEQQSPQETVTGPDNKTDNKTENKPKKEPATAPPTDAIPKPTAVTESSKEAKKSDSSGYNLQMGSFSNQENAGKMAEELKQKGHTATIEKVTSGDKEFYKVKIVNSTSSQQEAKDKAEQLKKEGFDAIVTSN